MPKATKTTSKGASRSRTPETAVPRGSAAALWMLRGGVAAALASAAVGFVLRARSSSDDVSAFSDSPKVRRCSLQEAIAVADRGDRVCVGALPRPAALAAHDGPFSRDSARHAYRDTCRGCNVQLLTSVHAEDALFSAHRRMYALDEGGKLYAPDAERGGFEYYEPNPDGGPPLGPLFATPRPYTRRI